MSDLSPEVIEANLLRYVEDRKDTARYASFDYCFNYFRDFHDRGQLSELVTQEHLQVSCLQLGFYLASWGMFRGTSHLLQGSMKHYLPLLEVIADSQELFELDVPDYDGQTIGVIRKGFEAIRVAFPHPATPTLVTKVMLGVFGCVPAYDTYFMSGFKASTFGPKSLNRVREFYDSNQELVERFRIPTMDFGSGGDTDLRYTAAKVVDMVFFIEGLKSGLSA
ncbi:MAG: hypothetical protein LC749_19345 [Actinobacteria bacterium]|nr:hypothetical protein [Actinomycetota bacterium]